MRVLRTDVHLDGLIVKAGTAEHDLPAGVEIPNQAAWKDREVPVEAPPAAIEPAPSDTGEGDDDLEDDIDDGDPDDSAGIDSPADGVPSRSGPGSAKARWLAYATSSGVGVDPESNRDEIIAALERAGIPTE